jgi:trehalose 6-phosphate phosphatase
VSQRLGFTPHAVVGSHGAEDPGRSGGDALVHALDGMRARIAARQAELDALGVLFEDKGHSLALHYRRASDPERAARCIENLLGAPDPGVGVFGGKFVANVVAAGAPDKGDAVVALAARAGADAAVFVGDDVNDEAVFRRAAPHWLTVRVGRDETAPSAAMYFLHDQAEVAAMLRRMLALIGAEAG